MKKNILVVCDNNTLYSKVAEAYLKKYAGYWKNIFSAGIDISGETVSPILLPLLEKENLLIVDFKLMHLEDYASVPIEYVVALTQNAFDYCSSKQIGKEVILLSINIKGNETEFIFDDIKNKLLQFVKKGTIKRWLEHS